MKRSRFRLFSSFPFQLRRDGRTLAFLSHTLLSLSHSLPAGLCLPSLSPRICIRTTLACAREGVGEERRGGISTRRWSTKSNPTTGTAASPSSLPVSSACSPTKPPDAAKTILRHEPPEMMPVRASFIESSSSLPHAIPARVNVAGRERS